jgi:hypothetical protein
MLQNSIVAGLPTYLEPCGQGIAEAGQSLPSNHSSGRVPHHHARLSSICRPTLHRDKEEHLLLVHCVVEASTSRSHISQWKNMLTYVSEVASFLY